MLPEDPENVGGAHKRGRLRCHKRPKSSEETPKEGNDSGWGVAIAYQLRRSRSALNWWRITDRYEVYGAVASRHRDTVPAILR